MSTTLANFLFEAVNFLLLATALGWLLFAPVRRALDDEREQHRRRDEESERLRAEADALAQQARAAAEQAERALDAQRQELLAAAKQEAAALLEGARATQQAERRALQAELAGLREAEVRAQAEAVGRLAAQAVRELLDVLRGPPLDDALVRAACAELEALPPPARRAAVVESARPLPPQARAQLEASLGGGFDLRLDDTLGAGVRVTTPAGQVDATATALARRASQVVGALEVEAGHA